MAALPAAAALLGATLIQVGTNLANDYFDYMKGGDRETRVGPTRVVQAGLLAPEAVMRATVWVLGLATLVGVYLVWVGGIPILVIGALSLGCAVAYTGGPFPLGYHGLGDVFVFAFFGVVAVGGTYWLQAASLPPDVLLAGAGVGALTTAILVVNNLRDIETDAASGKHTLAVRLGRGGTKAEYVLLVGASAVALVVGVALARWPGWALIGIVGLWPTVGATVRVLTSDRPHELNAALVATARSVMWYGGLTSLGFLLGP
jgi:1,4-dihydroxy-2-naphthoate octaprenyltransferase